MTPAEVSLVLKANIPPKTYGGISQSEYSEMIDFRKDLEEQGYILA